MMESKVPLRKLRKKQNKILQKFSEAIRGNLTKIQRLKVVALVTIEIHARDVIDRMYKVSTEKFYRFRFYLKRTQLNNLRRI